jgi:cytochrome c-type biogenesis protein CcmF
MLAIGAIGSSFYDVQKDFVLAPGESATIGNYEFNYLNIKKSNLGDRIEQSAEFQVYKKQNNLGSMIAKRTYYPSHNIAATRAAIRSNPIEDFYIVPSEFGDDGKAVFRVYVNPLVWWMWMAGPVMMLGAFVAVSHKISYQQNIGTRKA